VTDPEKQSETSVPREPSATIAPLPAVSNSDRVEAAQRGDLMALNDLLDSLTPWVGRLCGSIALDAGPDAAQETLIQVMRDLKRLRDPTALRSWVRRIATREAIRHAERRRREPLVDHVDRTLSSSLDPGLRHDVECVLAELPADQRAILVLRDLEGLSEAEAARVLDVAQGTIKSRLHRARRAFRQRWPT
jgi:RNA polymerase sigma-70 factor (ECF subfamily)